MVIVRWGMHSDVMAVPMSVYPRLSLGKRLDWSTMKFNCDGRYSIYVNSN